MNPDNKIEGNGNEPNAKTNTTRRIKLASFQWTHELDRHSLEQVAVDDCCVTLIKQVGSDGKLRTRMLAVFLERFRIWLATEIRFARW